MIKHKVIKINSYVKSNKSFRKVKVELFNITPFINDYRKKIFTFATQITIYGKK